MTELSTEAVRKVYAAAPIITEANRLGDFQAAANSERFDIWLAEVKAEAKREALEEAADFLWERSFTEKELDIVPWLRARATSSGSVPDDAVPGGAS